MTEKLRFDKFPRNRRTINRPDFFVSPPTGLVDCVRKHFFSGPAFAKNQYGYVVNGSSLSPSNGVTNRLAIADNTFKPLRLLWTVALQMLHQPVGLAQQLWQNIDGDVERNLRRPNPIDFTLWIKIGLKKCCRKLALPQ